MGANTMLWNKDLSASVKAGKIRTINIYDRHTNTSAGTPYYEVFGWYNSEEYFNFGEFSDRRAAINFMYGLHEQIAS